MQHREERWGDAILCHLSLHAEIKGGWRLLQTPGPKFALIGKPFVAPHVDGGGIGRHLSTDIIST
jgi:hypothetical protein